MGGLRIGDLEFVEFRFSGILASCHFVSQINQKNQINQKIEKNQINQKLKVIKKKTKFNKNQIQKKIKLTKTSN